MININENYLKLKSSYLFAEIEKRVSAFKSENPDIKIISLGIGDVTKALPEVCIEAFRSAIRDMSQDKSFRGYGPYERCGYFFG
jgi:LL-diaminopimelate aminotransferase